MSEQLPPVEDVPVQVTPFREFAGAVLRHPSGWVASGFGAGFAPVASGTVGSAVAILPWLALRELPWAWYLAAVLLAFAFGVWASDRLIRVLRVEDPGVIVWDEFVGLWITLFAVPDGWGWVLAGFFVFRAFDVVKPFPINIVDRSVKGGFGAMFDDALAGIYALGVLQAAHFAWLQFG